MADRERYHAGITVVREFVEACTVDYWPGQPRKFVALSALDDLEAILGIVTSKDLEAALRALDLHKERIRRLQDALCECPQRDFFQADLHDETCPVYVIAEEQKREYEPRV